MATGHMQLFNFKSIKSNIQFLSHTSPISSTQESHVSTVLESTKHTTNEKHCFQTFSWESNKQKRKISLTLNSSKTWRTVDKVTQEFQIRQGEAGKRTCKFQSPDSHRRLGGKKSAKFNTSRSENQEKLLNLGASFPSRNH